MHDVLKWRQSHAGNLRSGVFFFFKMEKAPFPSSKYREGGYDRRILRSDCTVKITIVASLPSVQGAYQCRINFVRGGQIFFIFIFFYFYFFFNFICTLTYLLYKITLSHHLHYNTQVTHYVHPCSTSRLQCIYLIYIAYSTGNK